MGVDEDEAVLDLAQLDLASPPRVEAPVALQAGLLRARHYHRENRAVSMADCIAAETARRPGWQLATAPDRRGRPEGWYEDPYRLHEDRWYSDGQPTKLVRDEGVESYPPE